MATSSAPTARSADIRVLIGGAMGAIFAELQPRFETASGHRLAVFAGATPELIQEITSDRPFDVAVVPVDVMRDDAARGRCDPATAMFKAVA